jgi:sarcosine oxidase, subunit alpha
VFPHDGGDGPGTDPARRRTLFQPARASPPFEMAVPPSRRFRFDGRPYEATDSAPLARLLARDRPPTLQRSIRYHRPRAPYCGVGYCTGCLVRVNGRPNVRACRYVPAEGDDVRTENAWPSPRLDLLGILDFAFPGGVDTLHGFRRPAWLTTAYQRVVRRLAGYGRAPEPDDGPGPSAPPLRRSADVVVVGGGASGGSAAARLRAAGRSVIVVDRTRSEAPGPDPDRLTGTITFLPPRPSVSEPFRLLGFAEPAQALDLRAGSVVVATGGYDGSLLFAGNDRPGVLTADGAFALARGADEPPFRHAVVVGGGPRAGDVLQRFGHRVEAVVAPSSIRPDVVQRASELEVPLYPRSLVLGTTGRARVRRVRLRSRGTGTRFDLDCDAIVLAHRRLPTPQLFFQAGARMEWRSDPGAYYPTLGPDGATSVPGLYAVGATAGVAPERTVESGDRAATAILGTGTLPDPAGPPPGPGGPSELEGYYRELLRARPGGRWIACPCEDVLLEEVEAAHRAGYRGIEVIKRYTGVGTGLCQGRYCLPDTLLLLALLEGRPPSEVGYITQRPPLLPTPLAALAELENGTAPREAP